MKTLSFFTAALSASLALAAPTRPNLSKRTFVVPVKGQSELNLGKAVYAAQQKWGLGLNNGLGDGITITLGFPLAPTTITIGGGGNGGNGGHQTSSYLPTDAATSFAEPPETTSTSSSAAPPPATTSTTSSAAPPPATTSTSSSEAPSSTSTSSSWSSSSSAQPTTSSTPTSASTSTVSQSASSTGSNEGEVTASPEPNDQAYLAPVDIGGQTLELDFDTGSADLWVFSTSLPSSESNGHTLFDPSKSSSWSAYPSGTWSISYGDGSTASGTVGFDTVTIGGVSVANQAVELATSISGQFESDTLSDGLVGLGFSNVNTVKPQQQKTWFENAMSTLQQPVFTADLDKDASGSYNFGEIDSSKYTGNINYVSIDSSNGFWSFPSSTFEVGGSAITCNSCANLIADTGTTLILLNSDVVNGYYAKVPGSGTDPSNSANGIVFPCSSTLPDFGVGIGSGYTATIPGSSLNYAAVNSTHCAGGIQVSPSTDVQILGDVFFKTYFAVFDGGNKQFGVAQKAS